MARRAKYFTYSIQNHISYGQSKRQPKDVAPAVDSVTDFGVNVDQHLKFDVHTGLSLVLCKAMLRLRHTL